VDTSTVVAAAVARDGQILASARVEDTRAHAEALMPLVQQVVAEAGITLADVDRIVAGVGPGPFTGLRVGVVTALTLGEALGVPVVGACSLDAVAAQWAASGAPAEFLVASDARRKEVFWARYDQNGRRVSGPEVAAPDALASLPVAGPGAHLIPTNPHEKQEGPEALDAGWLAVADLPDAGLEPLYLRRPDAEVPTKVKSALPKARIAQPNTSPRQTPRP
ncbi:MAG: tRNA (adenosine(37)-N6)-threonylcarbamoyltransferase complex dimerization subunit type 1 TsaB, partial [Propionibacteriaceae bacterium]|nr:tRNA (adenosine(37)-N6)-threonylcarbamoyltransferase complex dimerization subunit type 1 TsaB [Propionibacteriaceae bacterium]